MSNQDIRLWARENIRGSIWFLLLLSFICSLPGLIGGFFSLFSRDSLAAPWEWALDFVGHFMNLASICVVLKLIRTGEQDLAALSTPFQPSWVGKALAVALLLSLWSVVEAALPDEGLRGILSSILGFVISTALFPIPYVLFFYPDWPVGKVISEGFRAGYGDFWDIVGFQIVLALPILGVLLVMLLSPLFGILAFPILIVGVAAIVAHTAYMILAQAKYAMERFMQ